MTRFLEQTPPNRGSRQRLPTATEEIFVMDLIGVVAVLLILGALLTAAAIRNERT